jgi:hypothetical protein
VRKHLVCTFGLVGVVPLAGCQHRSRPEPAAASSQVHGVKTCLGRDASERIESDVAERNDAASGALITGRRPPSDQARGPRLAFVGRQDDLEAELERDVLRVLTLADLGVVMQQSLSQVVGVAD